MNTLVRCNFSSRTFSISALKPCFTIASCSFSAKKAPELSPAEKVLRERNRKTEPGLTKGEIHGRVTLAPQIYETSMEDNFQRTTVEPIGEEMLETKRTWINAYNEMGFTINNETIVIGAVAMFPKTVLSWRVTNVDEITPESMVLFTIVEPKLDIVVVGTGDKKFILPIKERLQPYFRKHNILLEVLDTPDACASFNFLNKEGRYVAAALFPALEVVPQRGAHSTAADWNKINRGWMGFSRFPSKNPIEDAKMQLEDFVERQQKANKKNEHLSDEDDSERRPKK